MRSGKTVRKSAMARRSAAAVDRAFESVVDEISNKSMDESETVAAFNNFFSSLDVKTCVRVLGIAYGLYETYVICCETEGFVTDIESVLSNYRKKVDVPDGVIKRCVWVLRAFDDKEAIDEEIDQQMDECYYNRDYDDTYVVEEVAEDLGYAGYAPTVDLKAQEQEQSWINVENACLYERVEAALQESVD